MAQRVTMRACLLVSFLIFHTYTQGNTGRTMPLLGMVGFESLPDQLVNKAVKKGFDFNILCIGKNSSHCLIYRIYIYIL